MIILLSPTKKQIRNESFKLQDPLYFEEKKEKVLDVLKDLNPDQIKKDFKISDNLTKKTYESFQNIDESSPAIYTYTGEAFNALNAKSLNEKELLKLNDHLLIFSALYGLVKPLNHITLYRLDLMNAFAFNLKSFWKDSITEKLNDLNKPIINLASDEFFQLVDEKQLNQPIYHVHFQTLKNDQLKVVSAHAKKARGAYTRALLKQGFDDLSKIDIEEFKFSHKNENHYYFVKVQDASS